MNCSVLSPVFRGAYWLFGFSARASETRVRISSPGTPVIAAIFSEASAQGSAGSFSSVSLMT